MQIALRLVVLVAAGLSVVGLTACQMNVVPLSAQAGSTVAVVVGDATEWDTFGYGGDPDDPWAIVDSQRGRLVFQLDQVGSDVCPATGPCELEARAASAFLGAENTTAAINGATLGRGKGVVVLVDIPADIEPGTYDMTLHRRLLTEDPLDPVGTETVEPVNAFPNAAVRRLTILPHQLDPAQGWAACGAAGLPACGASAITGGSTPYKYWWVLGKTSYGWVDASFYTSEAFPNPEVLLNVPNFPFGNVFALEVEVYYPKDKIGVLDAVSSPGGVNLIAPNARPLVFFEDDPSCTDCPASCSLGSGTLPPNPGKLKITAIAHPQSGSNGRIRQLGMVFDLVVDPTDQSFLRLEPATDLCIRTLVATDEDGNPLGAPENLIWALGVI